MKKAPEFLEPLPEELEVDEGSEVTLSVRVSGKPTPKLKWMIGSKPLKKSGRIEMRENSGIQELIIRDVTLDDEGVYSCVAVNKYGEAFCDCELMVEGKGWGKGLKERWVKGILWNVKFGGTKKCMPVYLRKGRARVLVSKPV